MPRPPPRLDDPVAFAAAFVNSYDPLGRPVDRLADGAAARDFLAGWLRLPRETGWEDLAAALRPWRDRLRRALRAAVAGEAAPLERLLRRGLAGVRWEARHAPALTFRPAADQPPAARVLGLALQGLAETLDRQGLGRLRLCQAPPCEELFFDLSKRGAQHFCGKRCATRVHVARHRARARG